MKQEVENIVLSNEDFFCKTLNIDITVDDIMAEVNAFDWLELRETSDEVLYNSFKSRLNFANPPGRLYSIREKAFAHKFMLAIQELRALVEEVNRSYNIPSKGSKASKPHILKYYYIRYWADKKAIAVDYNEQDYNKRKLFNFYTILFNIFAEKLENYNTHANIKTD